MFLYYINFFIKTYWPIQSVEEGIVLLLIAIGAYFASARLEIEKVSKFALVFFACYFYLVILSLIINREKLSEFKINLIPFNSYYRLFSFDKTWCAQFRALMFCERIGSIVLNVFLLFPLGMALRTIDYSRVISKFVAMIIGISISLLIEIIQLVSLKGTFEIDDIIHNALGFYVGFLFASVIFRRKKNETHNIVRKREE